MQFIIPASLLRGSFLNLTVKNRSTFAEIIVKIKVVYFSLRHDVGQCLMAVCVLF